MTVTSKRLINYRRQLDLRHLALGALLPIISACQADAPAIDTGPVSSEVSSIVCSVGYTASDKLCTTSLVLVDDGQTQMGEFVGMREFETVSENAEDDVIALTSAAIVRAGRGDTDGTRLRLDPALFPQGILNYVLSVTVRAPDTAAGTIGATGYQAAISVPPLTSSGWLQRSVTGSGSQTDTFEGTLEIGIGEPIPFMAIWPDTDGTPSTLLLESVTLTLTYNP